jgi:hypothetical protein
MWLPRVDESGRRVNQCHRTIRTDLRSAKVRAQVRRPVPIVVEPMGCAVLVPYDLTAEGICRTNGLTADRVGTPDTFVSGATVSGSRIAANRTAIEAKQLRPATIVLIAVRGTVGHPLDLATERVTEAHGFAADFVGTAGSARAGVCAAVTSAGAIVAVRWIAADREGACPTRCA